MAKRIIISNAEIGGTLPENIPPDEPIKSVEKRLKTSQPRLTLEPQDAMGIANCINISEK